MSRSTPVESAVDDDTTTAKAAASEPLAKEASEAPSGAAPTSPPDESSPLPSGGEPMHWPNFWDELADDWARVQAVQAEEVGADATA